MKKILLLAMLLFMMIVASMPGFSQNYKTAADTPALNKEYAQVSNNITNLTAALSKAQNDLAGYTSKSGKASSDAQRSAQATADKAANATDGSVKASRRAKKQARRSVKDAKDSRRAGNALEDQKKKVSKLTADLAKNQERLKELDRMRAAINNQ